MAFRCSICDVSYNSQKKIDTHYNTKKHKKQVLFNKDLSSSSEDTTEENDVHDPKKYTNVHTAFYI